ncbi:MAG: sulfatase-like hydrolase/transferase [Gemmatimonadales bacterium]
MSPRAPVDQAGASARAPLRLGSGLALAAAAALVAAALELAALGYLKFGERQLLLAVGRKVFWWVPIGLLLLIGAFAVVVWLAGAFVPRLRRPASVAGLVTTFATISPFLAFSPRLHPGAALLLALGIGVQAARIVDRDPARAVRRSRRLAAAMGLVLLVVAIAGSAWERRGRLADGAGAPPRQALPNVLIIVLDTVRAVDLSLYGYHHATTPFLEALAKQSVVFDWAIAPSSWTLPTHASIFTGRWPSRLDADWKSPLSDDERTLAEQFRTHGYRTGGFVGNLTYTGVETGLAQGFETYVARRTKWNELIHAIAIGRFVYDAPRFRSLFGDPWPVTRNNAPELRERFLEWVDATPADQPFFGFLNLFDAHDPYLPQPEFRGRFGPVTEVPLRSRIRRFLDNRGPTSGRDSSDIAESRLRYDEAIASLDEELRTLIEGLERRGRLGETVVVIASDHGELFGEGQQVGHGGDLQINTLHVPLLLTGPGIARGVRVERQASLRDLGRTILDVAGLPATEFDGHSLRPLWEGRRDAQISPALSMISGVMRRGRRPGGRAAAIAYGSLASRIFDSLQLVVSTSGATELNHLSSGPPWARSLSLGSLPADSLGRLVGDLWTTWGGKSSRVGPLIQAGRLAPRRAGDPPRPRMASVGPPLRRAGR